MSYGYLTADRVQLSILDIYFRLALCRKPRYFGLRHFTMEEEANRPMATVPIHVPQPEEHGPPTLAQPASGPVAEMSGALKASEGPTEPSKVSSVGKFEGQFCCLTSY